VLLHELAFPHDADYKFYISDDENNMIITDKKG
jgi:hypothetical protein